MNKILNKIFSLLCSINKDKYQHFTLGTIIAAVAALLVGFLPVWVMELVSIIAVVASAIGKELYDTEITYTDILATVLGGIPIWIVLLF